MFIHVNILYFYHNIRKKFSLCVSSQGKENRRKRKLLLKFVCDVSLCRTTFKWSQDVTSLYDKLNLGIESKLVTWIHSCNADY